MSIKLIEGKDGSRYMKFKKDDLTPISTRRVIELSEVKASNVVFTSDIWRRDGNQTGMLFDAESDIGPYLANGDVVKISAQEHDQGTVLVFDRKPRGFNPES